MLPRFLALLSLLVAVALANIAIEKQILKVKRERTLQVFQTEILLERNARLKLRTEELTGPLRTFEHVAEAERADVNR